MNFLKLKPGVNRSLHLFTVSVLWSGVGLMLMFRGWVFLGNKSGEWFMLAAIAAGTIKSRFILDRSFKGNIQRILNFRDGTCLGAVYSWKLWALVVVMILSGYLLRTLTHPGLFVGTLYFAIGWGLLLSSRHGWAEWFHRIVNAAGKK